MPKKPPKNAFFFFMLYVKRKEEARGRRFPNGLADVSLMASERWTVSCVFFLNKLKIGYIFQYFFRITFFRLLFLETKPGRKDAI